MPPSESERESTFSRLEMDHYEKESGRQQPAQLANGSLDPFHDSTFDRDRQYCALVDKHFVFLSIIFN